MSARMETKPITAFELMQCFASTRTISLTAALSAPILPLYHLLSTLVYIQIEQNRIWFVIVWDYGHVGCKSSWSVRLMLTQDQVSCSFSQLFWKYLKYGDYTASLGDLFQGCVGLSDFIVFLLLWGGFNYYYLVIMQHSLCLFFFFPARRKQTIYWRHLVHILGSPTSYPIKNSGWEADTLFCNPEVNRERGFVP